MPGNWIRQDMAVIFGITGWKNSGKTSLVSALVAEYVRRGLTVSTVKHAHKSFDIDHRGTDSHIHRTAGAREVAIVSPKRWALMHEIRDNPSEPTLSTILGKLVPCDLVLVEGYKTSDIPKIECIRYEAATDEPIWKSNKSIVAVACDAEDAACPLPQFALDDIPKIADYVMQKTGLRL